MKDLFTIPKAEICKISCLDVVYTSGIEDVDNGNVDPENPNGATGND